MTLPRPGYLMNGQCLHFNISQLAGSRWSSLAAICNDCQATKRGPYWVWETWP